MTPTQLESLRVAIVEKLGWTDLFIFTGPERIIVGYPPDEAGRQEYCDSQSSPEIPNPPTDPAAALEVIAALKAEGWNCRLINYAPYGWRCCFIVEDGTWITDDAPTLPLAVALAAAKVWGIKI